MFSSTICTAPEPDPLIGGRKVIYWELNQQGWVSGIDEPRQSSSSHHSCRLDGAQFTLGAVFYSRGESEVRQF